MKLAYYKLILFSIKLLEKLYNYCLNVLFLPLSAIQIGSLKEKLLTSFLVFHVEVQTFLFGTFAE